MRKIILLLCIPICSAAQFSRGNMFVGGRLSFENINNTYKTGGGQDLNQSYSISPSFGIFLKENLAVGIQLGYSGTYSHATGVESKLVGLTAGLFVNRYFILSEKFLFAINGGVNFFRARTNSYYNNISTEFNYYDIRTSVSPIFIFFPSSHWGFQASMGSIYFDHLYMLTSENTSNDGGLSFGGLSFGVAYYIR